MTKRILVKYVGEDEGLRQVRLRISPDTSETALRRALAAELGVPEGGIASLRDKEDYSVPVDYGSLDDGATYMLRKEVGVLPSTQRVWEIFVKTLHGWTTTISMNPQDTIVRAKEKIAAKKEGDPLYAVDQQRLIFRGKQLAEDDKTLSDCGIKNKSTLHVMPMEDPLKGDVGEWGAYEGERGVGQLMSNDGPCLLRAEALDIAGSLGGSVDATYIASDTSPLSYEQRQRCIEILDERAAVVSSHDRVPEIVTDLKVDLTQVEIAALLGPETTSKLQALHPDRDRTRLLLRRSQAYGRCICFHTDCGSKHTVQVALNGDDEYKGGRLCYITARGLEVPRRPAGFVTIHDDTITHGVSRLISGARYGLFVLDADAK